MQLARIFLLFFLACAALPSMAQSEDSSPDLSTDLPEKYLTKVDKKISSINELLSKKSAKYLAKFGRREIKLKKKLRKIDQDSLQSFPDEKYTELFKENAEQSTKRASRLKGMLPNKSPPLPGDNAENFNLTGEYNPYIDSLSTSLNFLNKFDGLKDKVKDPLASLHNLQGNLKQSEKIKEYIAERKSQLKESLSRYTNLPKGLRNQYDKLNKTAYYYGAQLREYKEMLNDPKKIEQKALKILSHSKLFQDFMKKNSVFASLFRMPVDNPNDPAYLQSLAGLQTREQMNQLIQNQISSGGTGAMASIRANMQQAQNELQQLKNKVAQSGSGATDAEMPDFKPNSQKTKSFLKRLELGNNFQTQRSNTLFPVTTDVGLSVGYKLNDKSIIGIGASYKMGWGQNFQHIRVTSQGAGLRSYIDYKIKKSLWLSGGYEMNYLSAFNSLEQLSGLRAWKTSALLGISKKLPIKTKLFKNTKVQLLWDFLSYQQVPRTQPVVFRIGYVLK